MATAIYMRVSSTKGQDTRSPEFDYLCWKTLKMVPEVCRIFCATANPTEVILAQTEQGRGILGVVDGISPKGVEDEGEIGGAQGVSTKDRLQAVKDRGEWIV
jgi:hypothetical protein